MADFDPVGIAMGNVVQPLAQRAIDAQQQTQQNRENQVFNQTAQAMSLGQRSAEMQQQQNQFDILQNLRQQQFDLQKNQSMAQVAAIQAETNARNIAVQNAQREYEQLPMKQDVANQMNQLLGSINDVDTLNQAQSKIAQIPNAQLIPSETIQNAILNRKNQLLSSATFQNTQKMNADDRQTVVQAQNLGLDLSDFAKSGTERMYDAYINGGAAQIPPTQVFDMSALRDAITQNQTQRSFGAEAFKSNLETQGKIAVAQAKNEGALAVAQTRADVAKQRITNKADLDIYNAANSAVVKYQTLLSKTDDAEEKTRLQSLISQQEDKMNSVLGKYDSSIPQTPQGKQAQGGYKIGTTYGGGMTYLGGDPNDPSNWKK